MTWEPSGPALFLWGIVSIGVVGVGLVGLIFAICKSSGRRR